MKPGRSQSLTLRLTLLFALASVLVLFLLGLLIGHSVERHFEELDMEVLSSRMEQARRAIETAPDTLNEDKLAERLENALTGHHDVALIVLGPKRQPLYSNMVLDFPAELLAKATRVGMSSPGKWIDDNGRPWRGVAASVFPGGNKGTPSAYLVAVATDISHHEHFMGSFRGTLQIFMALAAMLMGLLGWFAVRRGLSPLLAIKRQAAGITAERLHTRLPAEEIPLELADLASALNDMLARLEGSFKRLSDFSSDLAHELRTPVSNLLTQTQVTLSKARTADEYRDILASNAEEFERLSRIVSDMLFLAKSDNALTMPHTAEVNLRTEVDGLIDYYNILAEANGIRLSVAGQASVTGDRLMLRRAIGNLLSNAFAHTPDGGEISLELQVNEQQNASIRVENSGETIPPEHLPRLFDRFYRVDPSRQRQSDGAGLGLAITRSILRAHGGEATVHSSAGKTAFTLSLPARRECANS